MDSIRLPRLGRVYTLCINQISWDPGFNGDPFFVDTVMRADYESKHGGGEIDCPNKKI